MKKLLTNIFLMATLASCSSQLVNIISSNKSDDTSVKTNIKQITKTTHTQNQFFKNTEAIIFSKSITEQKILKNNLFNAIEMINNKIIVNKYKLDKKIWNNQIFKIISSTEYEKNLNTLYLLNLISFNNGTLHYNKSNLNEKNGIWTEAYWYWFGWWKLCLGNDVCNSVEDLMEGGIGSAYDLLPLLEFFGLAEPIAFAVAPFLFFNWFVLNQWNYGNGVWIGILYLTPDMGWGSN